MPHVPTTAGTHLQLDCHISVVDAEFVVMSRKIAHFAVQTASMSCDIRRNISASYCRAERHNWQFRPTGRPETGLARRSYGHTHKSAWQLQAEPGVR